jgi:hypothetical protein
MVTRIGKRDVYAGMDAVNSHGDMRALSKPRIDKSTPTTRSRPVKNVEVRFRTNDGQVGGKRKIYTPVWYDSAAAAVIIKFFRDFTGVCKTKKAIAVATFAVRTSLYASRIASSVSIEQFGASFDLMMRPFSEAAIRSMRRFIVHSQLLDNMKSVSTHVLCFSSRILRSLDVCIHTSNYGDAVESLELVASANTLVCSFRRARRIVINGYEVGQAHRLEVCKDLKFFNETLLRWQYLKSKPLVDRMQVVLQELHYAETRLRTEVQARAMSCVRKPFVQAEADRCNVQSRKMEQQFLRLTSSFGGRGMLLEFQQQFEPFKSSKQRLENSSKTVRTFIQTTYPGAKSGRSNYKVGSVESKREMHRIVTNERCLDVRSVEGVHHEAVLDTAFYVNLPHMQRDDTCLKQLRYVTTSAHDTNMRRQLVVGENKIPLYGHARSAIKKVRQHLEYLHIYTAKDRIMDILDDDKLRVLICDGSFVWANAVRIFHTIIYAMRCCVGTQLSREILYARRNCLGVKKEKNLRTEQLPKVYQNGSCGREEAIFVANPRAYNRLLEDVAEASRGGNSFNLRKLMCPTTGANLKKRDSVDAPVAFMTPDSIKYALDENTYKYLMLVVQRIQDADLTKSTSELGGVFCDTMGCITEALNRLDVCLTNTNIVCTRMSTITENVKKEQSLVVSWFNNGLGMVNTIRWLRSQSDTAMDTAMVTVYNNDNSQNRRLIPTAKTMMQFVYRGYVSIIMAPNSQNIEEVDYPELLVLDIEYIQKARSVFYGNVAQATVLVIIGQRLTEAGIYAKCIHSCIGRVSMDPAFILLGKPETVRGDKCVSDGLVQACSKHLHRVLSMTFSQANHTGVVQTILNQIVHETAHNAYPSSAIASSIAKKWTTATLKACAVTPGGMFVVNDHFVSPQATRAAFSSELLLPKAALNVASDFHIYVIDIIKRASFNFAVHSGRYMKMASIL